LIPGLDPDLHEIVHPTAGDETGVQFDSQTLDLWAQAVRRGRPTVVTATFGAGVRATGSSRSCGGRSDV
jgi:hypothetical protein